MSSIKIHDDECIDILTKPQYKIIQKKKGYRFSLDSILLADFCHLKDGDNVIDLGTGSGVIPLSILTNNKNIFISGLEILHDIANMALRSVKINNLESKIAIINDDLKNVEKKFNAKSFDVVICNPPYYAVGSGNISPNQNQAIARHEVACTLKDVVQAANYLLKDYGRFYIIYKLQRIFELFFLLNDNKLTIQKMRFVHPDISKKAESVLIESVKKGKNLLSIMPPLIIYDPKGNYTKELQQIFM